MLDPIVAQSFHPTTYPEQSASFRPSKPEISAPLNSNNVLLGLLTRSDEMRTSAEDLHQMHARELSRMHKDLEETQAKKLKKMQEACQLSQESSTWSILQTIGYGILSAINAVFGGFLLAEGSTLAGGMMLAAGLISISNVVASNTLFWEWLAKELAGDDRELEKTLKSLIPAAVGLVAVALTIPGAHQIWQLGDQIDWGAKILLGVQVALQCAEGAFTIGKGSADYRKSVSQSEMTELQHKMQKNGAFLDRLSFDMQEMMDQLNRNFDAARRIIKSTMRANQLTMQI